MFHLGQSQEGLKSIQHALTLLKPGSEAYEYLFNLQCLDMIDDTLVSV